MKINLALVAMALVSTLTGCGNISTVDNNQALLTKTASGGIVYAAVAHGWPSSVKTVCEKPGVAGDERCTHQNDFVSLVAQSKAGGGGFGSNSAAWVFAPKSLDISGGDILKLQLHGTAPASVLAVASRGNTPACYWKRGFPSGGGVVCPKFGWDYRTDLAD